MNIDYLKSFKLIAHLRSIKDAAQKLHLSQPALSHQLQTLEEELGVQVIDRNTKPLQLTEAGRILDEHCGELFEWVDEVTARMKSVQSEMVGRISLAAPPGLGNSWLLPRLIDFQTRYPDIEIQVELLDLSKVRDRLEQHRADCILTISQFNNPNVIFHPLFEEEMVLICDTACTLASRENWTMDKIANAAWVTFSDEDNTPRKWLELRFGKKVPPVRTSAMVNDHSSMLRMLKGGRQIAVLPRHLIAPLLKDNQFVEILPSKDKALLNQVYCGVRKRKQMPRKFQVLIDMLTS